MQPIALWVAPVSNLAGVARHIIDVAAAGLPGYRLVVTAPEGPLLDELRAIGCPVIPLPVDGERVATTVRALRRTIRRLRPQVVHSHLAKADFLVTMATAGLPVTLVSTEHHIPEDPLIFHGSRAKAAARQAAHRARIRRFDRLIAVSASTRRDMRRYWHPSTPITVVLNGVDRIEAAPRRPGLRILSLARLSPEKNIDHTLRVFAKVVRTHPQARLTIAGTGPEDERLQALAEHLGVADATTFAGFVDAQQALADHDVLLQPSKADNYSYTLLDAVNAGLGVVASDVGGNPEILPAHCVVPLPDESAMVDAVIDQGLHPDRRPSLPRNVPTVPQMCDDIVSVYRGERPADRSAQDSTMTPRVSVVIAYYGAAATIREQLDALVAQRNAPAFEVVIGDNEGSYQLASIAREYDGRLDLRILDAQARRGQSYARNVTVAAARGEVVAICDADDVVCDTWVAAVYENLSTRDVLLTGPLRLDRLNSETAWRTYLGVADDVEVTQPVNQEPFGFLGYERFAIGCNFAVRRTTWDRLGGMDERIVGGTEDVDFSWRAIESGVELVCDPAMSVDYRLRTDQRSLFRQRRNYQRSQLRLWALSQQQGRPVRGMSLRWAVSETAKLPVGWVKLRVRPSTETERFRFAAHAGGVLGNLQGQIQERVIGGAR